MRGTRPGQMVTQVERSGVSEDTAGAALHKETFPGLHDKNTAMTLLQLQFYELFVYHYGALCLLNSLYIRDK